MNGRISLKRKLTLGADPELFVFSGVKLLPAWEFLSPKEAGELLHWDGFQAEWNYNHLNNECQDSLIYHTRERLLELLSRARQKDVNARLSLMNVVRIPNNVLKTANIEHVQLGCMPVANAYQMKGLPVPDPRKLPYRFAGGHLHFGTWTRRPDYEKVIKTLDSILGVWSVGAARHIDNPIRRQYYGLAGEYRAPRFLQGYGVEYRVLSNFWLASPEMIRLVWDIGKMCVRLSESRHAKLWAGNEDETVATINNNDWQQARKIITRNSGMFRWLMQQVYKEEKEVQTAFDTCMGGIQVVTPEPENLEKNWGFNDFA